MNKTQKRQLNIRNKLFAAIAMLLVSSIMMVSTTYAWFTLSTAPEVQGITTTVGANGNLEIALSPENGNANGITSAMGDSQKDWTVKNQTWGNLINLSDASYKLDQITLLPARLNGAVEGDSLVASPLQTPVYGADGRLSTLDANTSVGVYDATQQGYLVSNDKFGVRVIGTSSARTPQQSTFYNSLAKMSTSMGLAQDLAEASLNNNGARLAEMAVNHANAGETDSSNYATYLSTLRDVLTTLSAANEEVEQAIRAGLLAVASSSESSDMAYTWAVATVNNNEMELENIWSMLAENGVTLDSTNPLQQSYTNWSGVKTKLNAANEALSAAESKSQTEAVVWADISGVMTNVMNTAGIKINDKNLAEFKRLAEAGIAKDQPSDMTSEEWEEAKRFIGTLTSGVTLQLGNGSGVYADIGATAGNLTAGVEIASLTYGDMSLPYVKATIKTTSEPANGSYLYQTNLLMQGLGAMNGGAASNVIDSTYGYIVDFMFRTNATGSSLMLQTAAAQRVYDESSSTATLGGGSTMSFASGAVDVQTVKGLMECIRVVFMDTASSEILGIAKLDMTEVAQEELTPASGNVAATYAVKAPLYLYSTTKNTDNTIVWGDKRNDVNGSTSETTDDALLCALPTNTAKRVSAMVYLDGDAIGNEDVVNAAKTMEGSLNLQFASSAELLPMNNSALQNIASTKDIKVTAPNQIPEDVGGYTVQLVAVSEGQILTGTELTSLLGGQEERQVISSAGGSCRWAGLPELWNEKAVTYTVGAVGGDGKTYAVDSKFNITNTAIYQVTVDGAFAGSYASENTEYTYTPATGKTVASVSVGTDGEAVVLTPDTDYTVDATTGVVTIKAEKVTGPINITTQNKT